MQSEQVILPGSGAHEGISRSERKSIYDVESQEEREVIDYYLSSGRYLINMSRHHLTYDKSLTIVSAAGGPITALLLILHSDSDFMNFLKALPAAMSGIAVAINSAFDFKNTYIGRDQANDAIIREVARFRFRHDAYKVEDRLAKLSDRCESILEAENQGWIKRLTENTDEKAGDQSKSN